MSKAIAVKLTPDKIENIGEIIYSVNNLNDTDIAIDNLKQKLIIEGWREVESKNFATLFAKEKTEDDANESSNNNQNPISILKELKGSDIIIDEEFENKKAEILKRH